MSYREDIFKYLFEGTEEGWLTWLESQPLLEQVDILNEFKEMIAEITVDLDNQELNDALKLLEEKTNKYQESILDEELAKLKLEMVEDDMAKMTEDMAQRAEEIREYILECITTNAPNAEEMKQLAVHVVNYEKAIGKYDMLNWLRYNPDHDV